MVRFKLSKLNPSDRRRGGIKCEGEVPVIFCKLCARLGFDRVEQLRFKLDISERRLRALSKDISKLSYMEGMELARLGSRVGMKRSSVYLLLARDVGYACRRKPEDLVHMSYECGSKSANKFRERMLGGGDS